MFAYWNGCPLTSRRAGTVRILDERTRSLKPAKQILDVGGSLIRGITPDRIRCEPVVRDRRNETLQEIGRDERREATVHGRDRRCIWQQDMAADPLAERSAGVRIRIAPVVMDEQRRTVVDQ